MIRSFRHRGLKRLYRFSDRSGLSASIVGRVEEVLTVLDVAHDLRDLNLPGYRLHRLQGELRDRWSISVSANWRIVFRIEDGDVFDVDLLDYH